MNISYNWLKSYVDTTLSAEQISTILTDIGLEVDGFEKIETIKGGLAGVVVGEVLTCKDHPDSDHLHVTTVDVGAEVPLQIVCGAENCRQGIKVVCATVGAVLYPNGGNEEFKIKKSKIRGVESFGMLCAEDELGIGTDHAGIMELSADAVVGMSAKELFGIEDDYLIEIGLTPNRVDAASHIGVARDLVAYLKSKGEAVELKYPSVEEFKVDDTNALPIKVEVLNAEAAPRYCAISVKGCKIAPSPEWMQNRLRAAGINPKNNLVDITNYILHELGQPLHAFDAEKVKGHHIIVKTCDEGTKFTTLDEVERTLTSQDLMICGGDGEPMCIAGVFGGMDAGISDTTTDVIIESAYFHPVWVRKSAKRFGLNTDASFRYERGIDPNIQLYAAKRAALLYKELAGGIISSEIYSSNTEEVAPFRFQISLDRTRSLIGKDIPDSELRSIIAALDIVVESEEGAVLSVAVPPYRVDVQREADLVEDILRIYGYNNIEIPTSVKSSLSYPQRPDKGSLMNIAADYMSANGYTEIMSNSLTKASYYESLEGYPADRCVKILNPLSADLNVMRQTLLFNTLEAVELNANRKNSDLRLYEFGNCYFFDADAAVEDKPLAQYTESYRLAIAVSGDANPTSWMAKGQQASYFTLRSMVERVLRRFGIDIYTLREEAVTGNGLFSEAQSFKLNGKEFMQMGVVSSKLRSKFDIKRDMFYAEIDFDALVKSTKKHKIAVTELSKYPEVKRDLALLIDKSVSFAQLRSVAVATEKKLLKSVTLFDVYEGDKLPAGKKSYALGFVLEDKTQTLTDKVIEKTMANLQRQLETKCGAQVRS
ncbi:MAG: phenylalanine--tRNA ligase subunit beta [Rikenellaceae bacterium]